MITLYDLKVTAAALDWDVASHLPPRVVCLKCAKSFIPTEATEIRYDGQFGVFFFYCEAHDHDAMD